MLPNVPVLLVRSALHMRSGWINLDYFLLTLLACAWSPWLALLLFIATYLLELVRLVDSLFYFSQSDPVFAARFLGSIHKTLVLGWAAAFVAVCGLAVWLWVSVRPRRRDPRLWQAAIPVGLVLLLFICSDRANGFEISGSQRHLFTGFRAVDELLLRVPLSAARPAPAPVVVPSEGSASAPLWDRSIAARRDNVLLVIVESMGLLVEPGGAAREFAPFQDEALLRRYSVRQGSVPFTGSTVPGEMRELCGLRTGMYITAETLKGQPPCLPQQYRKAGYDALAFHGFRASFFQRSAWYPMLGFTGEHFFSDMAGLPACDGAYYGTCDAAVAGLLRQHLQAHAAGTGPPQFLYWMTLSSHLPIDAGNAPKASCPVAADAQVCAQLAYVQAVLAAVKAIAMDPAIGRTAIVLVGDHAPPYVSPAQRDLFDNKVVPFLYLSPR